MKTMDHQQAVKMHAAERYLLEELSPEERDGFEEHYFGCIECADHVRAAFTFADNAKAVMTDRAQAYIPQTIRAERRQFDFWAWLRPAFAMPAAAMLLLGVTLYQSVLVIPRLERRLETATQPRVLPSAVARAVTRGEVTAVRLSDQDQFIQVVLDINTAVPVSSYTVDVYDESGSLKFAVPATVPARGESLNLLLPASELTPGRYTIRVRSQGSPGSGSETSDEYTFAVQR